MLLEIFGSPFMRSINVVVALLFGYFIAAVTTNDGNDYVVSDKINAGVCICSVCVTACMELTVDAVVFFLLSCCSVLFC